MTIKYRYFKYFYYSILDLPFKTSKGDISCTSPIISVILFCEILSLKNSQFSIRVITWVVYVLISKISLLFNSLPFDKYLALIINSFSATFCNLRTNKRSPFYDNNTRKISLFASQKEKICLNVGSVKVNISSLLGVCFSLVKISLSFLNAVRNSLIKVFSRSSSNSFLSE